MGMTWMDGQSDYMVNIIALSLQGQSIIISTLLFSTLGLLMPLLLSSTILLIKLYPIFKTKFILEHLSSISQTNYLYVWKSVIRDIIKILNLHKFPLKMNLSKLFDLFYTNIYLSFIYYFNIFIINFIILISINIIKIILYCLFI
jgi:hypothetical protein